MWTDKMRRWSCHVVVGLFLYAAEIVLFQLDSNCGFWWYTWSFMKPSYGKIHKYQHLSIMESKARQQHVLPAERALQ